MRRFLFPIFSLVILTSLVLAACGTPVAATPITVEVTRIVTSEAQAPAPAADTPATGDATPTAAAAPVAPVAGGERLQAVLDRGNLICGAHGSFQGFGFLDTDGNWSGFDVDFCRAWAAALFNDADAVEFVSVNAQDRFTALQADQFDVLSRNSTWSYTRDAELGLTFGPVTFYDGQAIMAKREIVDDPASFFVPPRSAYTAQVPRLFSESLADNIVLGQRATRERLREAVKLAVLDPDLERLEQGIDTMVGARGVKLSGGQVQRSAAARMLATEAQLLVFDDLSSALDLHTEAELWRRLFENRSVTCLVVSHRKAALERADQILLMDHGRLVDRGRLSELLERSALMRELWEAGAR